MTLLNKLNFVAFNPLQNNNPIDVRRRKLMLSTSVSVVALAKKMAKPDTKTVTRKISMPKTKVIKQPVHQASKPAANDAVRTAIKPITPQKPLPNQKIS